VTRNQELDLLGVDLLATAVDEVLDAALDRVAQRPAVPAGPHEIAGTVEALGGEGVAVAVWRGEVPADGVRPARGQLSGLALGHLVVRTGPQHADFIKGRDRDTDGLGPQVGGRVERGEQEQPLAHAERLGDVHPPSGQLVEDPAGDPRGGQHPGAEPGDGVVERRV
jgi:hypothetical protein